MAISFSRSGSLATFTSLAFLGGYKLALIAVETIAGREGAGAGAIVTDAGWHDYDAVAPDDGIEIMLLVAAVLVVVKTVTHIDCLSWFRIETRLAKDNKKECAKLIL